MSTNDDTVEFSEVPPMQAEVGGQQSGGSQQMLGGMQSVSQTSGSLGVQAGTFATPTYVPLVDIYNTPEEIRIVIDTPGFEQEDIHMEVDDGMLMVTAERNPDRPDMRESHLCQCQLERPQRLERLIHLPPGAEPDAGRAENEHGTTTIVFTKNDSSEHHKIGFQ